MVIRIAGECGTLLECGFGGVGITAGSELLRRLISLGLRDTRGAELVSHKTYLRANLQRAGYTRHARPRPSVDFSKRAGVPGGRPPKRPFAVTAP